MARKLTFTSEMLLEDRGSAARFSSIWPFLKNLNSNIWIKTELLERPVMLHRAIFGSIERFFGILIEHFAGKFPLWISPLPIRIITVADRHSEFAHEIKREILKAGFICDMDESSESVNKKIRTAQLLQINYMLTVGDKEVENKTVSLRTRDNVVHGEMNLLTFLNALRHERDSRSLEPSFKGP